MSNHRRARTRGHDTHAQFRLKEERAAARGETVMHVEPLPKDYTGEAISTPVPVRVGTLSVVAAPVAKVAKKKRATSPRKRKS